MRTAREIRAPLRLVPDTAEPADGTMATRGFSEAFVVDALAARPAAAVICRLLDVVVAAILLVLLVPLFIAAALAIKLDSPGPVLFRQLRIGLGVRPFTVNKFRTMRSDARAEAHHDYIVSLVTGQAKPAERADRPLYKLGQDDRITAVGRFLRRFSIDELPQLYNVLVGDMSLVGPRPAIPYEVDHYERQWYRRFCIKPGMTGLWQVSGRNELTFRDMMRLDIAYAEGWCLRLNLLILAKTAWVVIRGRGAA
jgi:lipopolysaccharide/colanic/teichoic acid biosynthesis glycosyltransferase